MSNQHRNRNNSPTRTQNDLAEIVEMLLEKGVVINADIAVTIGDAELLGIQLRAALASFETASKYGLEFPTGTDMQRVAEAAGQKTIDTHTKSDEEEQESQVSELEDQEREQEPDGGTPVAPLFQPPITDNAPWLNSPPITGDQDDLETDEKMYSTDCPWIDPAVSTRPRPRRLGIDIPSNQTNESDATESDDDGNADEWDESEEEP
ncbi:gas vesicle protein GvpJ [Halocatena pleomorpha]|uniref:Gas vesicle protein n=1 Tax=Halocatena pleomorpha TaxID=1785090 RepID=A0A3P3R852_9EURY|nr:gas vesicle protein [Halocatena pleomorpha]RRJ29544.1 gas vesicle protein [Halocatena pleomorpha]